MTSEPLRVHNLINQTIAGMIYKLNTFLEKNGTAEPSNKSSPFLRSMNASPKSRPIMLTEPSMKQDKKTIDDDEPIRPKAVKSVDRGAFIPLSYT